MTNINSPCKDCGIHSSTCHGNCKAYYDYAKKMRAIREARRDYKRLLDDLYTSRLPTIKRNKHNRRE